MRRQRAQAVDLAVADQAKFDNMYPVFLGGVTVGAHAGWRRVHSIDLGSWAKAAGLEVSFEPGTPAIRELAGAKPTDRASPLLAQFCATARRRTAQNKTIAASIGFTNADGRGDEITAPGIALHDVTIGLDKTTSVGAGAGAPVERYRLRYRKMTCANMSPSSPEVSQAVKASLMRPQGGHCHAAGVVIALGDGSVRQQGPSPRRGTANMNAQLTYNPRAAVLSGVVAGRSFRLQTLRHQAGLEMNAWLEAAQAGQMAPPRVTPWLKAQEIRPGSSSAGMPGKTLKLADDAQLEVYDYPGAFAAKKPGEADPRAAGGAVPEHRNHGRVVWVKLKRQTGFPGGGFHIHGPPLCGNPHCIVVAQNWDSLLSALTTTRQTTIVVEL